MEQEPCAVYFLAEDKQVLQHLLSISDSQTIMPVSIPCSLVITIGNPHWV